MTTVTPAPRLTGETRAAALDLWVRAWTPVMPAIDFGARRLWLAAHLDALAEGGAILLLAHERAHEGAARGALQGFLTLHPGTGAIDQLAVAPEAAGRGVGRALMAAAKARARATGLRLDVNRDNARACRFYRDAGFIVTGTGVNPGSGLPTLAMAWAPPEGCRAAGRHGSVGLVQHEPGKA